MENALPVQHRKNRPLHNTLSLDVDTVQEACTFIWAVWVVIYVNYITYECLLHNTLAIDVDTVQEAACIHQTRV